MDEEVKQLKSVLRSLVVSSPTQVDVKSLCRDYRNMVGTQIPNYKYGYSDPVTFLKDRFSDCFLFQGPTANPELTLIVPDTLKHIDKFVQKQKTSVNGKYKSKRRSVPESVVKPTEQNLIVKTFTSTNVKTVKQSKQTEANENKQNNNVEYVKLEKQKQPQLKNPVQNNKSYIERPNNGTCSQTALENFLKRRSAVYTQQSSDEVMSNDKESLKEDDDSGRQTSSSSSSSKRNQMEELKQELRDIILSNPDGVWCADLLKLYRERFGREFSFPCFGYSSVLSFACTLPDVGVSRQATGDWLLSAAGTATRASPRAPLPPRRLRPAAPAAPCDPDDALPGVAFEPDVFPEDCVGFLESVPSASLAGVAPGTMLEVAVAEVYSPSHFWVLRLGERYNIAMENMMDEMNEYYTGGEGKDRVLAPGAVRVGHYCSSLYDGDWHRSLIVQILDGDTVKVRHVDYGTVERCAAAELRALPRRWVQLEAQALRARLAGVRPPGAGRRWPRPAALHFLHLVRERRLVANVVAVDAQDAALEVLLIDTTTRHDRCVAAQLVRAGHADERADSALGTSECYLYPRFEALENGDTPNFAEIHAYLRDGIALEFVDDYRRHVPSCLPDAAALSPAVPTLTTLRQPPTTQSFDQSPTSQSSYQLPTSQSSYQLPTSQSSYQPPTSQSSYQPPTSQSSYQLPTPQSSYQLPTSQSSYQLLTSQSSYHLPTSQSSYQPPGSQSAHLPLDSHLPHTNGAVTLSAAECEVFALLSRLRPAEAHRYMLGALSRALAQPGPPATLDPLAAEFQPLARCRPPPGFERH